jgi:hypothetical protein
LFSNCLINFLGAHFSEEKLGEYLNRYGWNLSGEVVTTSPVQEGFDSFKIKEDLDFINKMTVCLENIAKSNISIKPVETIGN